MKYHLTCSIDGNIRYHNNYANTKPYIPYFHDTNKESVKTINLAWARYWFKSIHNDYCYSYNPSKTRIFNIISQNELL